MELQKKVSHYLLNFESGIIQLDSGIKIVEGVNTGSNARVLVYCLPVKNINNKMKLKKFRSLFQRCPKYPQFNKIKQSTTHVYFFFDMMTQLNISDPQYHHQVQKLRNSTRFSKIYLFLQDKHPRVLILPVYNEDQVELQEQTLVELQGQTLVEEIMEPQKMELWEQKKQQFEEQVEDDESKMVVDIQLSDQQMLPEKEQLTEKQFEERMQKMAIEYPEIPKQLEQFEQNPQERSESMKIDVQLSKLFLEVEMETNPTIIIEDPQIRQSRLKEIFSKHRILSHRFQYCFSIFELFDKTIKSHLSTNKAKNEPRSLMIPYLLCLISFLMLKQLFSDLKNRKNIFNVEIPKELTYNQYIRKVEKSLCLQDKWVKSLRSIILISLGSILPKQYSQEKFTQIDLKKLKKCCISCMNHYIQKNRRNSYRELLTLQTIQVLIETFEDNNYCCHTYDKNKLPPTWNSEYYSYLKGQLSGMKAYLKL